LNKGSCPDGWSLFSLFYVESDMWKLVVGFIIFAALALYMLSRGGDIDLGGEKHGLSNGHPSDACPGSARLSAQARG
jgi:putative exporter of polyketide antibiotics